MQLSITSEEAATLLGLIRFCKAKGAKGFYMNYWADIALKLATLESELADAEAYAAKHVLKKDRPTGPGDDLERTMSTPQCLHGQSWNDCQDCNSNESISSAGNNQHGGK